MSRGARRNLGWYGLVMMGAGVFLILIATRVLPIGQDSFQAPRWVVVVCGGAVVLGGVLILFQAVGEPVSSPRYNLVACVLLSLFTAVPLWIAFGPGERRFSASVSLGVLGLDGGGDVPVGRVVFGIAAVLMILITLAAWRSWLRSVRGSRHERRSL